MSSYVRKKAVRYKFDDSIVKELKKEIEDSGSWDSPAELLARKYKVRDCYQHEQLNEFVIDSGWESFKSEDEEKEKLFLDYLLDYEYDASGDFESVRELTEPEFKKYKKIFEPIIPDLKFGELRLVHYAYYNGVDEPSVWKLEEI